MARVFPGLVNQCALDEEPNKALVLYFPGCNDRCIGIDYQIWNLQRYSNAEVLCIEYGYKLERYFVANVVCSETWRRNTKRPAKSLWLSRPSLDLPGRWC